jgi:hypothetical protein
MARTTWEPVSDPDAARSKLPDSASAFPTVRREPLLDAAHVRNALARSTKFKASATTIRALAFDNIRAAAACYGVHVSDKSRHELARH